MINPLLKGENMEMQHFCDCCKKKIFSRRAKSTLLIWMYHACAPSTIHDACQEPASK
jgi:ribosomal protein L37AE/L43A